MQRARSCINAAYSRLSSNIPAPVSFEGYHCVGYVKSAHGIRGELFLGLFAGQADWDTDTLHLLLPGQKTLKEFVVESLSPHKEGLIAAFEGVNSRNDAEALKRSQVYVSEDVLEAEEGDQIFLKQILNFEVADADGARLGEIVGFSSNGLQDLLQVRTSTGQYLVPFVEDFIVDIDFDKKQVRMDLPPGLLE